MGYVRHHAIVVTAYHEKPARRLQLMAKACGLIVSPLQASAMNGYYSFFCGPDGSKEGWNDSNEGDEARDQFIQLLKIEAVGAWVEVQYGDDEGETKICRHSDQKDKP